MPSASHNCVEEKSIPVSVEKGSGQLPGESWQTFFDRRDARCRNHTETPKDRQARLSREQAAATKSCPGKRGPTVWYWKLEGGYRIRTQINQPNVESYWSYGRDQKHFDGWLNCWDICTEFGDPDPESNWEEDTPMDNTTEGRKDDVPGSSGVPGIKEVEEGEVEEEPKVHNSTEVLGRLLDQGAGGDGEYQVEDNGLSLAAVAYKRYGFDGLLWDVGSPKQRQDWNMTCMALGNGRWLDSQHNARFHEERPGQGICNQMQHYLYMLVHCDPPSNFDTLQSLDLADLSSDLCSPDRWEFSVKILNLDSGRCYLLSKKEEVGRLHLLVQDPVAVLQALHCNWGPTLQVVAGQLYNLGIQFRTLYQGRRPTRQEMGRRRDDRGLKCILGYRRSGYKPDSHDWHAYEVERDRFLRSHCD
ncbi:hypothetical protein V5O48_006854 [Marasmius crinis-equi]|uniref:Uncharacterized protein n=1 Tax=Marasmius crinis-equi TaxID=585013 RepID=A0ABR3FIA4_9AGAR